MQTSLQKRLQKVRGQLESLKTSIDEQASCEAVIPQFLAVRGALNAAFLEYVQSSLAACEMKDEKTRTALLTALLKK